MHVAREHGAVSWERSKLGAGPVRARTHLLVVIDQRGPVQHVHGGLKAEHRLLAQRGPRRHAAAGAAAARVHAHVLLRLRPGELLQPHLHAARQPRALCIHCCCDGLRNCMPSQHHATCPAQREVHADAEASCMPRSCCPVATHMLRELPLTQPRLQAANSMRWLDSARYPPTAGFTSGLVQWGWPSTPRMGVFSLGLVGM